MLMADLYRVSNIEIWVFVQYNDTKLYSGKFIDIPLLLLERNIKSVSIPSRNHLTIEIA